jgi:hypothetical protein
MEVADAELTVSVAVPEMAPDVAVMVVVPDETASASPFVGELSLTLATAVFEELQLTLEVMFCVLLSL